MKPDTSKLFGSLALLSLLAALAACDPPPKQSEQQGYRGTGMVHITEPEKNAALLAANQVPPVPYELDGLTEPLARDVYENVPVLGHLPEEQFTRLMAAMTEWVAPDQGCAYCHNEENLADDSLYTKIVARRMLQMTQHINADWSDHVAQTGVTCYTCHRGQPVPANIWFTDPGPAKALNMAGYTGGQDYASATTGSTSLPYGFLTSYLLDAENIRVHSTTALPSGNDASIQMTERSYGLMIHMSESLGVNCTTCHNSRAFNDWNQSNPQRVTAWHGIRMARELNNDYLAPLQSVFPANRLGPEGDAPKLNCATCHNGVQKPLYGVSMVKDYPSLQTPAPQ